jgi:hypothetical protein
VIAPFSKTGVEALTMRVVAREATGNPRKKNPTQTAFIIKQILTLLPAAKRAPRHASTPEADGCLLFLDSYKPPVPSRVTEDRSGPSAYRHVCGMAVEGVLESSSIRRESNWGRHMHRVARVRKETSYSSVGKRWSAQHVRLHGIWV